MAEPVRCCLQAGPQRRRCSGAAHHRVAVAGNIFGERLDADVHTQRQRLQAQRRCPGVVDQRGDAAGPGNRRDRRHVLDFERQRTRRFQQDGLCLCRNHISNAAAAVRIKIAGGDAQRPQQMISKGPARFIGAVGDQQLVTGLQAAQQTGGDRRHARREQLCARCARLQLGEGVFQCPMGLGATPAVIEPGIRVPQRPIEIGEIFEQDGGCPRDRRIDHVYRMVAAGLGETSPQSKFRKIRPRRTPRSHGAVTSPLPPGYADWRPIRSSCHRKRQQWACPPAPRQRPRPAR